MGHTLLFLLVKTALGKKRHNRAIGGRCLGFAFGQILCRWEWDNQCTLLRAPGTNFIEDIQEGTFGVCELQSNIRHPEALRTRLRVWRNGAFNLANFGNVARATSVPDWQTV
ncbi:hypothetical protein [Rhizobium multihospitium]|uniref:hypothetical protein n=1 Tax=Rhizobium multihospitium TaxID=410764 RepID=UPI001FD8EE96|nr:hypothetical protein [Rhizobium multihospitium]